MSDNGYASLDDLLQPARRRFKDVVLPVSGHKVRIRSLFENESEKFQGELLFKGKVQKDKAINAYRRLIVLCVCHSDSDQPVFSSQHIEALNSWDGADINHLGQECEAHCGFVSGEVERMAKNSETVRAAS